MGAREKWLLTILTGIFVVQASVLIYGVSVCSKVSPKTDMRDICPQIGERFDLTFGTMVATTLALLTGSTLASQQKKDKTEPPKYIPPLPEKK